MPNLTLKHPALNPHGISHAAYGSVKAEYCYEYNQVVVQTQQFSLLKCSIKISKL
jgi:hypothetical protein